MKTIMNRVRKHFLRGALFILFLAFLFFVYNLVDGIVSAPVNLLFSALGAPWLIGVPGIPIVFALVATLAAGTVLSLAFIRSILKRFPIVSIPLKFAESVENLNGFPIVLVAQFPGIYAAGFVTGIPVKNGIPFVAVFIPDLPSFLGGRTLIVSLSKTELIMKPKGLGEIVALMLSSNQNGNAVVSEATKTSGFETLPLADMSFQRLRETLQGAGTQAS